MRNCNECKHKGALSQGKERSYSLLLIEPAYYGHFLWSPKCLFIHEDPSIDCTSSIMSIIMMNSTKVFFRYKVISIQVY